MKTYTIKQKMSNSGTIHDLNSDQFDRDINFRSDCIYAVVLAAFYGGRGYTTHKTAQAAVNQSMRMADYSHKIIDSDGNIYTVYDRYYPPQLVKA